MTKESNRDEYTVCDQCRTKKIRCGREKPSCGNCIRLGLQCEWSGQGKKRNQTALLSHTILGLGSRLQGLETSILDTQKSLKRLFEDSSASLPVSAKRRTSHSRHITHSSPKTCPDISGQWSPDSLAEPVFKKVVGRFYKDNNHFERYFGPTSLESLVLDIKDIISEGLDCETRTVREIVLQAQCKIDLFVGLGEDEAIEDDSLPTAPPFAILDALIEPYFKTINHHFPIWTRQSFGRMATGLRQSASSEQDLASIICCNNLILVTLSANSLCSHRQTYKTSSVDFDFIAGFLSNAKRALKNIDRIIPPRLINVQALLSLNETAKYLVAQEHFSTSISERLLALATQCAKSIGIHQWHSLQSRLGDEDVKERRNISYCMYILDKAHCWTAGFSPNIPVSEVHIDSALMSSEDIISSYLVTKVELAAIEESIYLEIYALKARERTKEARHSANRILANLQRWLTESKIDLDEMLKAHEIVASKIKLAICFTCAKLLLIWPNKRHLDARFQESQEFARICMRLLLRLWRSPPDQGCHALFLQFVASLPPLYLYEILRGMLRGEGSESDMDMLHDFLEMLQIVTVGRDENTYTRRLYQMTLIAIDVIKAKESQYKRQKPSFEKPDNEPLSHSDHASLHGPISHLLSPPSSNSGFVSAEVQESEDQTFDMFQDPDNFMTTFNSPNDEASPSFDELLLHMGSYAKVAPEHLNSLAYD